MSCTIEEPNFFASEQFFTYAMYSIASIEIPIQAFGTYCILVKTPQKMNSTKWCLLNCHIMTAACDLNLNLLCVPFLLLPAYAGIQVGISRYIGVPDLVQTRVFCTAVAFAGMSIVSILENRYYILTRYRKSRTNFWRISGIVFNYASCFALCVPITIYFPDQEEARVTVHQMFPCLPQKYSSTMTVYFLEYVPHAIILILLVALMSFQTTLYFTRISTYFKTGPKRVSRSTLKLQKKLFSTLCVQIMIPICILAVPLICLLGIIVFDFYNQVLNNMICILISTHGLISTLVMLRVHSPYWKATCSLFGYEAVKKFSPTTIAITNE